MCRASVGDPLLSVHASLPGHLCSFLPSVSRSPHLFFLGEQTLPVLLTALWPGEQPEASFVILAV